jgi:hypothetical protein
VAGHRSSFELESPVEVSAVECRRALHDLGWEVSVRSEGRLTGREDLALLRCIEGPIDVEAEVLPRPGDRSEIVLDASMVGRGAIQSKRLRERIGGLERQIRRKTRIAAGQNKL